MNRLIVIFLLFTYNSNAQELIINYEKLNKPDSIISKIIEKANATKSLKCSFIYTEKNNSNTIEVKSSGILYLKKPHQIKWEYKSPKQYEILLNKKKSLIKEDFEINDFFIEANPNFNEINNILRNDISNYLQNSDDYLINYYSNNSEILVQLVPKDNKSSLFFQKIELFFNKVDFGLQAIKLNTSYSDELYLELSQRYLNIDTPKETFKLK